jgi:hypothetical protein
MEQCVNQLIKWEAIYSHFMGSLFSCPAKIPPSIWDSQHSKMAGWPVDQLWLVRRLKIWYLQFQGIIIQLSYENCYSGYYHGLMMVNHGQSWLIMAYRYIYIELLVGGDWNHGIWSDFP